MRRISPRKTQLLLLGHFLATYPEHPPIFQGRSKQCEMSESRVREQIVSLHRASHPCSWLLCLLSKSRCSFTRRFPRPRSALARVPPSASRIEEAVLGPIPFWQVFCLPAASRIFPSFCGVISFPSSYVRCALSSHTLAIMEQNCK